jgi:hypothetical protein
MPAGDRLPSECRALVPLAADPTGLHKHRTALRPAAFIAHLIACNGQLPQMRERRRAEPAEVVAAYAAVSARLKAQ